MNSSTTTNITTGTNTTTSASVIRTVATKTVANAPSDTVLKKVSRRFVALSPSLLLLPLLSSMLWVGQAQAINKCQDAEGRWHYGDSVKHKCKDAEVTTLNDRGVRKKVEAAPKTEAEKKAEEIERQRLAKLREEKRLFDEERDRILGTYETEDDIERARENNLRSIRQQMVLRDAYITSIGEQRKLKLKKIAEVASPVLKKGLQSDVEKIDQDLIKSKVAKQELSKKMAGVNESYDAQIALFRKHKQLQQDAKTTTR